MDNNIDNLQKIITSPIGQNKISLDGDFNENVDISKKMTHEAKKDISYTPSGIAMVLSVGTVFVGVLTSAGVITDAAGKALPTGITVFLCIAGGAGMFVSGAILYSRSKEHRKLRDKNISTAMSSMDVVRANRDAAVVNQGEQAGNDRLIAKEKTATITQGYKLMANDAAYASASRIMRDQLKLAEEVGKQINAPAFKDNISSLETVNTTQKGYFARHNGL